MLFPTLSMHNNIPAICLTSGTVRSRISTPSNFFIVENMILEMFKLRPIPMASLATRTSNSLLASLNMVACHPTEHISPATPNIIDVVEQITHKYHLAAYRFYNL